MKKILILLMACIGFTAINTEAQTKKKTKKHRTTKVATTNKVIKMGKTRNGQTLKNVTVVSGKSINDGTTGVMGKEPIRDNAKGKYRNMNSNSGNTDVPPSDGGGGK